MANQQEFSVTEEINLSTIDTHCSTENNDEYLSNEEMVYPIEHLDANDIEFKEVEEEILSRTPVWFDFPQTVISFTGREEQLKLIADSIEDGIVVVCGLSGVGKSELVAKYAQSQYSKENSLVWINAATRDSTVSSFCRLAKEKLDISVKGKGLKVILDQIYEVLNSHKCLLIFDDAENYKSLEEFLPTSTLSCYFILITSRNVLEWKSETHKFKVLPPMNMLTKMEATQFIKKQIEISSDDREDSEAIALLIDKLYCFPPFIKYITEYIQKEKQVRMKRNCEFKISDYLKLLENAHTKQKVMLQNLICGVWQVTADKLEAEEDALFILNIISYFEPKNIPAKMLRDYWSHSCEARVERILILLQKYCIICLENDMISIPGLVQEAIRIRKHKNAEKILKQGLRLFKDYMTTHKSTKVYIPHVISLWNYAKEYNRLVESFIVDEKNRSIYFNLIAESNSDNVVKTLVQRLEKEYPDKLIDVINTRDNRGKTALHHAIHGGNECTIKLLIEKGADVHASDNFGHRPLHLAARYGQDIIVKALLDTGVDVNCVTCDKYKFTPLHFAVQNGHKRIVISLLEKKADINARTLYEFTPLHLASRADHAGIASYLLKNTDIEIEAKTLYKFTPLHLAAQNGHLKVACILLNEGASVNALDREHFTPLHMASQRGHLGVVNEFLQNIKVNINAKTVKGNTPLHLAMENGHLHVVQALFENNADCEIINTSGKTALDLAMARNHLDVIEFLQGRLTLDSSRMEGQNQEKTFGKTATSIDGVLYEVRLLTLLLLTGFREKVISFNLASNLKQGHKLDDIVFKCNYEGRPKLLFLQAKHRQDPKEKRDTMERSGGKNKLTINHLFPDSEFQKTDFSLLKYFDSYLKIKKQFSTNKVKDPIFGNRYVDLDCDFVVYTNAEAAFNSDGNSIGKPMVGFEKLFLEKDDVLNFSINEETTESVYYKIIRGKNRLLDEKIDTLKKVSTNEADITEFLNKFKLFVGQPNVNKLSEIIKYKMQCIYNISNEDILTVFSSVESRVLKWWNEEKYYLTKENRFLHDAIRIDIKFDIQEPVALFTGRSKKLLDLHKTLQNKGWSVVSQAASVTGLGGIGKSELARKYVNIYSSEYDGNVLWINASSYLTIDASFRKLAKDIMKINTKNEKGQELNIEKIVPEVYKYFTERQRKSLFIFDNAVRHKTLELYDESIDKFLPTGPGKPHILITSRDQEWGDIKTLSLDVFTESEATEFIFKALGSKVEENEAKKLAEQLQYFPLALQQAVAYIRHENKTSKSPMLFTITDYLVEYEKRALNLFQEPSSSNDLRDRYTGTVFTTWTVTIDKIKQNRDGKVALYILNILGYLASDNIPIDDIFYLLIKNTEIRHYAVELLNQYSMAYLERGMLKVHRLVQHVTRIGVEQEGNEEDVVKKTYLLLTQGFPYTEDNMESYAKKQKLLSHFEEFLKHFNEFAKKPKYAKMVEEIHYEYVLLVMLGQAYGNYGNPAKQRDVLERALDIVEKRQGPEHLDVASGLCNLSEAYKDLGNPWKQLDLLDRADAIYKKHYKPDDIEMTKVYTLLSTAYGELGEPLIQKQYIERALAINKKHHGPKNLKVIKLLDSLASVYGTLGDPQKQKDLLEEVLSVKKLHFGTNHISYASSLSNLSSAYGDLGDPQMQKKLLKQVLEIEEKFYGSDNFTIAPTLVNLGAAYGDLGKYTKEKELLERAYAIEQKHFGANNYKLAGTMSNLAIVNGILGHHEKALELLKQALPMLENHYGPNHFQVARLLVSLGNSYGDLGQAQMQKELIERALVIDENFYGPNHFEISKTLVNLGNAYASVGDYGKQKELVERALNIDIAHYGPEHTEVATSLGSLALAYGATGDYQKEIELLERSLEMVKKFHTTDSFEVGRCLYNLANAYGHSGNDQKKKELLEAVLPIFLKHYNRENEIIENILLYLGKLPSSCWIAKISNKKIILHNK